MAPKHVLLSSSSCGGPGVGEVNNRGDPRSSDPAAWIQNAGMVFVCSPRNGKRTRAPNGMLCIVTIGAVLMLMMQSSLAADGKTMMLCYLPTCVSGCPYLITLHKKTISTTWQLADPNLANIIYIKCRFATPLVASVRTCVRFIRLYVRYSPKFDDL